ncbi:MAG: SDR family NAD(P)-dependent oxidoreductase [Bacteroidetes bacterium]|jgi:NAD(P)-dependent dehydrogenase (short-subunit alcohol dehydrogenase family)|nr:SDR family NAD(P)-dependent oxidoreductase [Bacteroidota bacterium]
MKKTVLITGASSGLGKALAGHFAATGHEVYGTSRHAYPHQNEAYTMLQMDVRDALSIEQAVGRMLEQSGRIDLLVNNAGIGIAASLEEASLESTRRVFDTNVCGVIRVCQAVMPSMRQAGRGQIINISSIGARVGLPFRGIYCGSKAALCTMTESLRLESKPFGIQVCSVLLGDVRTNINANRIKSYKANGPYAAVFEKTCEQIDREVEEGMPADKAAQSIGRLSERPFLPPHYTVGKPLQRLSITLKNLLPATWFEWALSKYVQVEPDKQSYSKPKP